MEQDHAPKQAVEVHCTSRDSIAVASCSTDSKTGVIDGRAHTYAENFAKRACPKGYDFHTDTPLTSRRNVRTYVFQCKG